MVLWWASKDSKSGANSGDLWALVWCIGIRWIYEESRLGGIRAMVWIVD